MRISSRLMHVAVAALVTLQARAGQLQLIDDPSLGAFIDLLKTGGQELMLDDDGEVLLPDLFAGNFVLPPGMVLVGMNGGVNFGARTVTDLQPVNQPIPSFDAFIGQQAALIFWDDIDDKEGDGLFLELPDRLIIQWNVVNFDGLGATLKFQIQAFDNPAPTGIYAQFLYKIDGKGISAGESATIGYQDGGAGFGDIQFSFNTADAVGNGAVLSLVIYACPTDLNDDGETGTADLLDLLSAWGPCTGCRADLHPDGVVEATDLLALLAGWGPCR